jgi:hypothetical protein
VKLAKAGRVDAESIAKVKTRITSCPSTTLPVREKIVDANPPAPLPSPSTSGHCIRDPSPSSPPENKEEDAGQSPRPHCRWHDAPEYSEDD